MGKVFRLFACCLLVKGVKRAVICDLQRDSMYFVTIPFWEILTNTQDLSIEEILESYSNQIGEEEIVAFFESLVNRDLGFWTDEPEVFPQIELTWENPSIITNAIIDHNDSFHHNFALIFSKLELVGCRDVQVRCYDYLSLSELHSILELLERKRIKSIEFIIKYNNEIDMKAMLILTEKYLRIKSIIVHSAPQTVTHRFTGQSEVNMGNIIMTEQIIDSNRCCGIISPDYFLVGLPSFTEGLNFNSCLNRKLGIDIDGSLKNCPSMKKSFGNIYTDDIVDVVSSSVFQETWRINKDKITTCKVCEFRYVCTDCRAFLESDTSLEKPLKCNYDPYSLEWKN